MGVLHLPYPAKCPICGSQPDIGKCEPWCSDYGPQPWYAVCYRDEPSHCVGANGDNQRQVMEAWNDEVRQYQQETKL